jgi:DNA (cytosine-5)-methyltransferase 1
MPTKVLNLYAGIGGNRKLWEDVDVTAVEWDEDKAEIYKDHFPNDTVVVEDAHEYLKEHIWDDWDFIWSSPPCPSHSRTNHLTQPQHKSARYPDMDLYGEIILLKQHQERLGYDYVVENVISYYEPLIEPQESGDHYFWSNFHIPDIEIEARNIMSDNDGRDSHFDLENEQKRLGYQLSDYDVTKNKKGKMLRNCVHPELGKHVFEAAAKLRQTTLI